jgi:hypothetical protein
MRADERAAETGRASPAAQRGGGRSELAALRATCRRQAHVIDALDGAMSTLRGRVAALTATNTDLRSENDRLRRHGGAGLHARGSVGSGGSLQVRPQLDGRAPGAARIVVAPCLGDEVPASLLDRAQLLMSEPVSNSGRRSGGGAADGVLVGLTPTRDTVGLEVEDRGAGA